MNSVETKVTL